MTILFQENVCLFLQTANKKLPYYQMFSFAAKREERREKREERRENLWYTIPKFCFPEYISILWNSTKLWKLPFPTFFDNISKILPYHGSNFSSYETSVPNSAPGLSSHPPKVHLKDEFLEQGASEQRKVFPLLLGWYWPHPSQASLRMRRFIDLYKKTNLVPRAF